MRFQLKIPTKSWLLWMLAINLLGASFLTHAQTSNHEGWYQVEMIVFVRKDDMGSEHWPSNISLRYPNNWVELKDPNATTINTSDTISGADTNTSIPEQTATPSIDLTKDAFYWLPDNERLLNAEATKLTRNPRFDVLFHQAWRQVITAKNTAKSIIINGGKQFGKHQELEGTITLSVATYLKIQTNLWFSQFDVNIGQEQQTAWPDIPLRPNYTQPNINTITTNADADLTTALEKENNQWNDINTPEEETNDYVTRQIILVKQARDMRSNELHYLDHPVLGVIVKIIPYSAPQ